MEIPDLPPDFSFPRLLATTGASRLAFEAKRDALGPHIITRWGWDEDFQRAVHDRHFSERPFFQIMQGREHLGVLSFMVLPNHVRFGEFYLRSQHHRQGIGTTVLNHCLSVADEIGLPVRLEYLRWNPVGSLYRRHGFVEIGQTDIHFLVQRDVR